MKFSLHFERGTALLLIRGPPDVDSDLLTPMIDKTTLHAQRGLFCSG
jgi:hypothetical protein